MLDVDTSYLSMAEAGRLVRARELSPVELTQHCLDRIAAIDPSITSFVTVTPDLAMEQAIAAEADILAGRDRGPLHGVPIALKDLYATKGIRTTAHSNVLLNWLPDEDATTTAKLAEAGTVLLGKLAMHEFAFGSPGFDTPFPPARNPWNPEHVTGGSSSGSGAALAAGLCYGALGSDTGGSIRSPAALCGIAGIKPTYGRVSRAGVVPLSWSLDHAGPMARTVEDCALMLASIAGYDAKDPASADVPVGDYIGHLRDGVRGLRLGLPRAWYNEAEGTDAEVMSAFDAALTVLEGLGAELVEVESEPFINSRAVNSTILIAEAYAYHEETLEAQRQDFGAGVRNRVLTGAFLSAADYIQAQRARSVLIGQLRSIMGRVDAIVSPAAARPASSFAEFDPDSAFKTPSFTNPFNLSGLPAISVPCGFSSATLPIGLQIAGRAFDEATVLRIAHAYEQATAWHKQRPPIG
jgi:aspartyl-tRNA(Asn)/glutamyl-tRNA(Gln) amidotransferase subunit A